MMALELLGVGVAPRHHRRPLGDALVRLAQPHPMLAGKARQPSDRRIEELGVGREGDRLGLHDRVHRDPLEVLHAQRAGRMRDPQALGEQELQLAAEPLAPMREVRALVRKGVLEELLSGEVLEIGVAHPALAHLFVGEREDVLEQQQPNHEPGLNPGPPFVAVERRDSQSSRSARCTSSCRMLMI